ncbi:type II secretion system protein GspG [Flexistipes sinusarabici]|uniref:type II secretion system protein GspG n=1 Tax=Flexistipes sinusarabici TaxID=2352 RepID=UPI00235216E3|nr:type II secretion system protein GspG [Flexistipes sinusarabici]
MINRKGFSPYETVIVICVIAVLITIFYRYYNLLETKSLYTTAKIDIQTIKLNIDLYKAYNSKYPDNLSVLKSEKYLLQKETAIQTDVVRELSPDNLILARSTFENGRLVDPFGNPYIYDNKTGKLKFAEKTKNVIKTMKEEKEK